MKKLVLVLTLSSFFALNAFALNAMDKVEKPYMIDENERGTRAQVERLDKDIEYDCWTLIRTLLERCIYEAG